MKIKKTLFVSALALLFALLLLSSCEKDTEKNTEPPSNNARNEHTCTAGEAIRENFTDSTCLTQGSFDEVI